MRKIFKMKKKENDTGKNQFGIHENKRKGVCDQFNINFYMSKLRLA